MVPAGTPKSVIQKLNQEVARALSGQEIRNKLASMGFIVNVLTPDQSEQKIKTEVEKWARVIKANNIQAD